MNQPFLIINPKAYLYGDALLNLAINADLIASKTKVKVYMTAPFTDLRRLKENTNHLVITAQHMDAIKPGRGMGQITAEALKESGARAVFLNHAEKSLPLNILKKTLLRAKENDIETILCADSVEEAVLLSRLNPTILLAEPTDLIGTGQTASDEYIQSAIASIKKVSKEVQIMIASGVSNARDVLRVMQLGADGTGATSGLIKATNPILEIEAWIKAIEEAKGMLS